MRGGSSQAGIAVVDGLWPRKSNQRDSSGELTGQAAIFVGTGPAPGPLAMLFPGQGSQYVGMLRELACRFPQHAGGPGSGERGVRRARTLASRIGSILRRPTTRPLASDQDLTLRDTRFAQPAIGAVSLGLLRILEDFGVRPDLTGGHSFGELTALCAAGRIDDRSLARTGRAARRDHGELRRPKGARARCSRCSLRREQVPACSREHGLDLVIANKNAPRQCVLSGPAGEIERAQAVACGPRCRRPAPCRSRRRFTAGPWLSAEKAFHEALDAIPLAASAIPVFANATAEPYPDQPDAARALLAGQLARPVEFVAQIEAMYRMGARTFLEVGPDAKLTGLVHAILEGRDHLALAVDAARGSHGNLLRSGLLARNLGLGWVCCRPYSMG